MLDEIDIRVLVEFSKLKKDEESSTWRIMKKIYKNGKNEENSVIKNKIKRMSKLGLFKINGEKITTYTLNSDRVFYKTFNFPCGNKKGLGVLFPDNKWEIYEL